MPNIYTVTTLDDSITIDTSDSDLTLREAIALADASAGADTIRFADGLSGLVTLAAGLDLTTDVTINGDTDRDGAANVTVGGIATAPSLRVVAGSTVAVEALEVSDSAVGILNEGTLSLTGVIVSENSGTGIIGSNGSSTTLTNVTLSGNGVGIDIGASPTTLTNVSVVGNGVGIDHGGVAATLTNVTVTGNGIGLSQQPDRTAATAENSIFAGNGTDVEGSLDPSSFNNVVGGDAGALFEKVDDSGKAVLADNGGPVQTIALKAGSAAIDGANGGPATDARGQAASGAGRDIGAYEHVDIKLVGTAADDALEGSLDREHFVGRGGDDTIIGGEGVDFAHYAGDGDSFAFRIAEGGATFAVRDLDAGAAGNEGTDTLHADVERLAFADGSRGGVFAQDGAVIVLRVVDAQGDLIANARFGANGNHVSSTFENGRMVSRLFEDDGAADAWSSYSQTFDNGRLTGNSMVLDSGNTITHEFASDGSKARTTFDSDENQWFAAFRVETDAAGARTRTLTTFDEGADFVSVTRDFDDEGLTGVTRRKEYDGEDHDFIDYNYTVDNGDWSYDGFDLV